MLFHAVLIVSTKNRGIPYGKKNFLIKKVKEIKMQALSQLRRRQHLSHCGYGSMILKVVFRPFFQKCLIEKRSVCRLNFLPGSNGMLRGNPAAGCLSAYLIIPAVLY